MINLIWALIGTVLIIASVNLIPVAVTKTILGLIFGIAGLYLLVFGLTYKEK